MFVRGVVAAFGIVFLSGCASPCRHFGFKPIAPGIYAGCRPKTQADFDTLRRHGIRTIISYETFLWHITPERRLARKNAVTFICIPIFASPLGPTERRMKEALLALDDRSLRPVYLHCLYGRDRTAIVIALYRIYFEDWPPQQAWEELLRWGFKRDWSLWGFERYFWNHLAIPEWARGHRVPAQVQSDTGIPENYLSAGTDSAAPLASPGSKSTRTGADVRRQVLSRIPTR